MSKPPVKVFISYAHDDAKFFKAFEKTLKTQLKSNKNFEFSVWTDADIHIGSLWDNEIRQNLERCDLAVLCISDSFLASEYIKLEEFSTLVRQFQTTVLAPFLLAPCNYRNWDELAAIEIFKPKGDKYDKATSVDFTFADLVSFNLKDGDLIPNPNIARYVKDFIAKVESALLLRKTIKKEMAASEPDESRPVYLNDSAFPFFERDKFFGRDELLEEIDNRIKKLNLPLLISGIGGLGKTTVAAAYGSEEYPYSRNYSHLIWIGVTENIFSSLFSVLQKIPPISFEYDGVEEEKDIENAFRLLNQVHGNNLLIIDNVNDENDLLKFINSWKKYKPTWKCIVTTRYEDNNYTSHLIKLSFISPEAAEELFKRYNNDSFDSDSFKGIYEYTGAHTFLIELLAKFAQESNTINSAAELLALLKEKRITAIDKNIIAKRGHLQDSNDLVSAFALSLYQPLFLSEEEQKYMRYFSVLPAKEIGFAILQIIFYAEDTSHFDDLLRRLAKKGWLIQNKNKFKCHQIIQEICMAELRPDAQNCSGLINTLSFLFENYNETQVAPLFEIGLSVANNINDINHDFAFMLYHLSDRMFETGNLTEAFSLIKKSKDIFAKINKKICEEACLSRIGVIYRAQGNKEKALETFFEDLKMIKELVNSDPTNLNYNDNYAVSYQNLGNTYRDLDNPKEALKYYLLYKKVKTKLLKLYPDQPTVKHGLASAYQHLGNSYMELDKPEQARKAYLISNKLEKELVASHPDKLVFKHALAITYQNLGYIYTYEKKEKEVVKCFSEYMNLARDLVSNNPGNVDYIETLAVAYQKFGSVSPDEKKDYYIRSKKIFEFLATQFPQNPRYASNLETVNSLLEKL